MPWLSLLLNAAKLPYGGQAAIEGVLMKGKEHAALAVRRRDGRIEVLDRKAPNSFAWLTKAPLVRGFFILWDMMTLGYWALAESSRRHEEDLLIEEQEEKNRAAAASGEEPEPTAAPVQPQEMPNWLRTLVLLGSLAIALFIFKILPAMAATGAFYLIGWGSIKELSHPTFGQQLLANTIEGVVKMSIFVGYIWGVGRLKDIQRVFEYHGAEHIVINAYEHDQDNQDLEFIQKHSVAHPRCGTSFIVILILLSVVLYTVLDWAIVSWWPTLVVDNIPIWWVRWPLRVLALPLLAGLSYEVIKGAFRYYGKPVITPLLRFGMLFQALTTRRPSNEQIEVSLASFNRARYLTEGIAEPAGSRVLAAEAVSSTPASSA